MTKTQRVLRLIHLLTDTRRERVSASDLAKSLDVTIRTVHNDLSLLVREGVPVLYDKHCGYRIPLRAMDS